MSQPIRRKNIAMDKEELKEYRKQWFADMEQKLRENQTEEEMRV